MHGPNTTTSPATQAGDLLPPDPDEFPCAVTLHELAREAEGETVH
jgi:hypothetical protein